MTSLLLIGAHLFGDFPLQNHWMQAKAKSSFVCSVHVLCYSLPWLALAIGGVISWLAFGLIIGQHWLQDRFALHTRWMKLYKQTPPEMWPVGPLCMDQAWHLSWIAFVVALGV
jgi:hypothetical protein